MPASQSQGAPSSSGGGGAGDIFILVAIVALAAALALAAGVFLYDRFLDANVQKKSEQLERARQAFEPALIQELVRLDSRLQAADDILARHLAPSELFSLLEELTLQSIEYDSMNYRVAEDNAIEVRLRGKARSVNGVALQASVLGQHNAFVNPIFSNLDLVNDGVTFEVTAFVNPSALRYTNVFNQYAAGAGGSDAFNDVGSEPSSLGDGLPGDQGGVDSQGATDDLGGFGGGQSGGEITQ